MLTSGISLLNFKNKSNSLLVKKKLIQILDKKNHVLESLSINYIDSYKKKKNK